MNGYFLELHNVLCHILAKYSFLCSAHLAASEGHLPCLKFIVCAGASIDHTLNARNDQVHKLHYKIKSSP